VEKLLSNGLILSASSIKKFEDCHRQFFLYKTEEPEGGTGSQLVLGSAIHHTCDLVNKKKIKDEKTARFVFEDEYKKQYSEAKKNGRPVEYSKWGNYTKDLREGAAMSAAWVRFFSDLPVIASEVSLLTKISTPSKLWSVEAHIDMVLGVHKDGKLIGYDISDIKSGASAPSEIYMNQDLQLELYCHAIRNGVFIEVQRGSKDKIYKVLDKEVFERSVPIVRKSIYNIREAIDSKGLIKDNLDGVVYETEVMSPTHFMKTFTHIAETISKLDGNYWPKHIGGVHNSSCKWCGYTNICKGQD
jgi:hypothetical protein